MNSKSIHPLKLHAQLEQWPLAAPFRISGYIFETIDVVLVTLDHQGYCGRGEAAGVYYKNDKPAAMLQRIEQLRSTIETGLGRESLQQLLPPGGARNALDCALWDLQAKLEGRPVWQLAGVAPPRPALTTFTCGADAPQSMADAAARRFADARALKLKLTGEPSDAERVRAVRAARQDVWLGVDANQGFTRESLERLMPVLLETRVALIEQPFPVGKEDWMDGLHSPIPIAADESVQGIDDISSLAGRVDIINIKLDKCGGLTEGLAMVEAARTHGLETMVGNMMGTSLAMAPAFVIAQQCKVVDLDGPVLLRTDRSPTVIYDDGRITCPPSLWGAAS